MEERLWRLVIDHCGYNWQIKGYRKRMLYKKANLTTNVMASMGENQTISFKNLEKICIALDCSPNDVFEFVNEKSEGVK